MPTERPGQFPYTRGIHPTMYQSRLWTMRQYAGFGDAADTNRRFKYLLQKGQTGLSCAFDLPTQMGFDSDHPMAAGEVGNVGVAISSVEDMATLLDGLPLAEVSTSMTINATAGTLLAFYAAVAKGRGVPTTALRGTIQNDVLKEYIARGTYIYPPRASMRLITDLFAWCGTEAPQWNTISISGYHIREAGSSAAQEIAFTLVEEITDRLEAEALALIAEVDALGGMVAAIERGFPQREIQDSAWKAQLAIDKKTAIVVGVNAFVDVDPPGGELLRANRDLERNQVDRLTGFRSRRNGGAVKDALAALEDAAAGTENTMPRILAAVEVHATLGEVADALRNVYGVYQESVVV